MTEQYKDLHTAFHLSAIGYFLDFVLVPIAAFLLLWLNPDPLKLAGVAYGAVIWSLIEYGVHRFVFHDWPLFERMHDVHHRVPRDWVGIASWGTFSGFAGLFAVFMYLAGGAAASSLTAGVMLGYLFYCSIHIWMHHGKQAWFDRYTAFMYRHHAGHHRGGQGNYGVSSPIWDLVFRTFKESK